MAFIRREMENALHRLYISIGEMILLIEAAAKQAITWSLHITNFQVLAYFIKTLIIFLVREL